jgi:glycosyltransferase involved in cell wall biosynthesis
MNLRILIACDFYPPFTGGSEFQMQLLGKLLSERGSRVSIATVWHTGLAETEEHDGVRVYRLNGFSTAIPWFFRDPGKRRFHPPFPDPAIVRQLRQIIHEFKPNLVHAYGWISFSCALALRGAQIPLMLSARDYGYFCPRRTLQHRGAICSGPQLMKCVSCASERYGLPKGLASVAGIFLGRPLLHKKVRAIHCISTFVEHVLNRDLLSDHHVRAGQIRTVIIPNILKSSNNDTTSNGFANRLPPEFILFVGALQPHKGIVHLLAAYQRIKSPPPLVLIGTVWPDSPAHYPANVVVIENVPHADVMTAWERCLFGVAPSIWAEPFGNIISEAMSKGKAMIASNIGGPVDIITDGVDGLLVPPGDIEALEAAMSRLIADSDYRSLLGSRAQKRIQAYTAENIIPRFEATYRSLLTTSTGDHHD